MAGGLGRGRAPAPGGTKPIPGPRPGGSNPIRGRGGAGWRLAWIAQGFVDWTGIATRPGPLRGSGPGGGPTGPCLGDATAMMAESDGEANLARRRRSERFLATLAPYRRVVLVSHVNPDPDA